jgi:hypothetical protein
VTGADNTWGFRSKDRSGRLDPIEEPHLGKLIAKCIGRNGQDAPTPFTAFAQSSPFTESQE